MGACDDARNTSALVQRWQKIQPAVNKFHSFYEQLERHPRSGTTPDDMKREAIRISFLSICFSLNLKYHDLFFLLFYGKSKENRSSNRRSSLENRSTS
ncbi:hypothetical protein LWI28_005592 [Acer negundo]|uniref:Uncharacterized protein n=1 Tax=Acer negundo TaxID=4023 RepID=A0AAD5NM46_ACENE|nr:hypothetical protein LWI28_005592 [Acer negundo]